MKILRAAAAGFFIKDHHFFPPIVNVMPQLTESTTNFNQQDAVNTTTSLNNARIMVEAPQSKDMSKSKRKMNVDDECDVIGDLIGHYGKWQFMMTILLSLFQVPNTFHIFSPTFQVRFGSLLKLSHICHA
jgi:hypothetical protein